MSRRSDSKNRKCRVFAHGFPGRYGGASTELHHQIKLWLAMGVEVHIIPSQVNYQNEPLFSELVQSGVIIHGCNQWEALTAEDVTMGFCNAEFLTHLPEIHARTKRTVFINCMTWLFDMEKQRMAEGMIALFLYQNEEVRQKNMPVLQALNPKANARFLTFTPYFDATAFPFIEERPTDHFGCGRISRQDADKYAANTLHIYEYFVAPVMKRGLFLGFDARSEAKIGRPHSWITTACDSSIISQQDFYKHCQIILQPSDTTENWPRVGFEAMASGSVLIVDDRGGWRQMIEHGKTGFLCQHERDFIYYASKMAYEPDLRREIAHNARQRGLELGGFEKAKESWERVFRELDEME
ncbi:MAG TPA: glycosyltransferase [Prosthecobacter sp.]|nr:glycosyltransferase [Prosthecobacter sp.]